MVSIRTLLILNRCFLLSSPGRIKISELTMLFPKMIACSYQHTITSIGMLRDKLDCSGLLGWLFLNLVTVVQEVAHPLLEAVINVKPLHASNCIQNNFAVTILLYLACVQHVVKQLGSSNVFYSYLLSIYDSGPQVCQLFHVLLQFLLFHDFLLFLLFDLVLGPSSLRAHLEQVGAYPLVHYKFGKWLRKKGTAHLRETDEEA